MSTAEATFSTYLRHPRWAATQLAGALRRGGRTLGRLASDPWARMRVLARFKACRRAAYLMARAGVTRRAAPSGTTCFPGLDVSETVRDLRSLGLHVGLQLPGDVLAEILDYSTRGSCYADGDPSRGYPPHRRKDAEAVAGARFLTGHYLDCASECGAVSRLEQDPVLLEIATAYLGRPPACTRVAMWHSYAEQDAPSGRSSFGQAYHFDLDDYGFLIVSFYLSEVRDPTHGPHVFVDGTHRTIRLRHQCQLRRFSDEEIEGCYGSHNVRTLYGPAGSGFLEDTYALHKGRPPVSRDRLMLMVQFFLSDFESRRRLFDMSNRRQLVA